MPDVPTMDGVALAAPILHRVLDSAVPVRLAITPAPDLARLSLRGDAAALGTAFDIKLPGQPGGTAVAGDRNALWLGPDEWLLLAQPGSLDPRTIVEAGAVVDISHRQVGLILEGSDAADALATGCPLDLHSTVFAPGACTRTVFGKSEVVLWRTGAHCFHVEVARSYAAYVYTRLTGAARELEACRGLPPAR